ncbi:MAG: hypothetical protein JO093_03515 [Acidobacteria bacterium]|nr:hypothetical protein [Acidobacteriota bacterium]MBV9071449.1 hypothetical protein [Acidobacteriota bacterium]MBV9184658.1 hypothetical protein [Acidobacteriota bacterium]
MSEKDRTAAVGPDGRTYQQYLDERRLLIDGERAAGEGFDKILLTLCAGAIALSVTFVEKVGASGQCKPLLYTSWGVLAFGLLLNVRAFLLLQNSYDRLLDMNDETYDSGRTSLTNPFRTRVGDYNHYSFWCFVIGITLLLIFAGVNYQASSKATPQPERMVITVEDNKGIITRIFEVQKTAAGPNAVKLPHGSQTTTSGGSQSTNTGTGTQPASGTSGRPLGTNK